MKKYPTAKEFQSDGSVLMSDGTVLECEIDHEGTFLRCGCFKVYLKQDQIIETVDVEGLDTMDALVRAEKAIDSLLALAHQFVQQPLAREIAVLDAVRSTIKAHTRSITPLEG